MDWDLKTPYWDFAEFETETEPNNIIPFSGTTGFVGEQKKKKNRGEEGGDCSVDLKLGRFGDLGGEISMNKWKETRVSTMISSPLTTLKRGRASNNGSLIVSCLVDGCDADLSKCRDYHRRHKVCEVHSKTPKVSIGGQDQRFCQQCSRFHLLVEFDEVKRSCRKRLDGHNRRRRKPQPEPSSINSGSLFPYQGSRFLPFSSPPQIFPSTAVASSSWPGIMKAEEDTTLNTHHLSLHSAARPSSFSVSFSPYQKGLKQFPFLQVNELGDQTLTETSVCQPLLNTIASSDAARTTGIMFSRALDSDCALSLLSSPATQHGISLRNTMHQHQQQQHHPLSQPLFPGLQYSNGPSSRYNSQGMEGSTPMASVLVSDDIADGELSCQGVFQLGPNGSSQNGIPQTLPFTWE